MISDLTLSAGAESAMFFVPSQQAGRNACAATPIGFSEIIEQRRLTAHFQPILDLGGRFIMGFEGLIRGPEGSPFHSPAELFKAARRYGLSLELELLCRQVVIEGFVRSGLPGKLFLNVSPETITHPGFRNGEALELARRTGLALNRIVIELTENQPIFDFRATRQALAEYRSMGMEIAIDDLGEGFSSLRLWSELRPDYVKIDMHFVQGINSDPLKFQLLKSVQQISESCGSRVIAEGIETRTEFMIVRDLGIALGQGYFIARPSRNPPLLPPPEVIEVMDEHGIAVYPEPTRLANRTVTVRKLLRRVAPVGPDTENELVFARFEADVGLYALPVVAGDVPVGLIDRHAFMDGYARLYRRELYGRKPCERFMDPSPLVVDGDASLQRLSFILVEAERRHLAAGFLITDNGRYAGLGTGQDLVREITQLQMEAARYANPLTLLPGNVPIHEHIDRLLSARAAFCACYCDLDNFKPFNDAYGYRRGDDMIQATAHLLTQICDPERDFVGHIGGDDFILLLQSADWEERCRQALERFAETTRRLFRPDDLARGGFHGVDRRGNEVFNPLTSLSIGAVPIVSGGFVSHLEVSEAATEAKRQAKRMAGNSLFVERRQAAAARGAHE